MSSVMVMVDVQDATVESLSSALQLERVTDQIEHALRNALNVPVEKRVMVEPFRNGLVLSVATSITMKAALRAMLGGVLELDEDELREAYDVISTGLRVVTENGG